MDDSWSPPPELCGPKPRQLKWKSGGVITVALTCFIFLVGFGILGAVGQTVDWNHRLKLEGKPADALVTRTWSESRKYSVAYQFSAEGKNLRGESEIPHRKWQGLSAGSHLPVTYVPAEPQINRAASAYETPLPGWLPPAIFAGWVGMLILAAYPVWKERRLLRYGEPAAGVITSHSSGRVPKYGYITSYEFQVPEGRTVKGSVQRDRMYFHGSTECILYDPKHPRVNGIYPLRLLRIADS